MKNLSLYLILFSSLFFSCTFYENGPSVCFSSPKERLEGKWYLKDCLINDQTDHIKYSNEKDFILIFTKQGEFKVTNIYENNEYCSGTWTLNKEKNLIIFNHQLKSNFPDISDELNILRLTKEELWVSSSEELNNQQIIVERHYEKFK